MVIMVILMYRYIYRFFFVECDVMVIMVILMYRYIYRFISAIGPAAYEHTIQYKYNNMPWRVKII